MFGVGSLGSPLLVGCAVTIPAKVSSLIPLSSCGSIIGLAAETEDGESRVRIVSMASTSASWHWGVVGFLIQSPSVAGSMLPLFSSVVVVLFQRAWRLSHSSEFVLSLLDLSPAGTTMQSSSTWSSGARNGVRTTPLLCATISMYGSVSSCPRVCEMFGCSGLVMARIGLTCLGSCACRLVPALWAKVETKRGKNSRVSIGVFWMSSSWSTANNGSLPGHPLQATCAAKVILVALDPATKETSSRVASSSIRL